MMNATITTCALALLSAFASAQDRVAVFEGPAGGAGSVEVYDATNGALLASPTELAGIRLLPIDFCARTALQELDPDRPQRIADVSGASRLRLQHARGSLYHFERALLDGTKTFGFLLVGPDASTSIVIERAGTGGSGTSDPFWPRIAVAPDAAAFLTATLTPGGGDLLEVALDGSGVVTDRTPNLPPRRFYPQSLILGPTFGLAVTPRGVLRFERTSGAVALQVHYNGAGAPAFFSGEAVASPDRSHAAFTAGDSDQALHVYSVGASGDALRVSTTPSPMSRAGTALEGGDGPWLAVSDDGTLCAWRTEDAVSRECWVGRTAAPVGEVPEQLSSSARFTDTLDEVGLFVFGPSNKLLFGVGERAAGAVGIEKLDLFSATVQPGVPPTIQNLSATSGDTTPPFLAIPQLKPSRMVRMPSGNGVLVHSEQSGSGTLYAVHDAQVGAQVLLSNVKSLDMVDAAGGELMFLVRRDSGNARDLYRVHDSAGSAPVLIVGGSSSMSVDRTAPRSDGWMGYVTSDVQGSWLDRTQLALGTTEQLAGAAGVFGPAVAWSAQGRMLYTRVAGGAWTHFAWPIGSTPVQLAAPTVSGQILPGS